MANDSYWRGSRLRCMLLTGLGKTEFVSKMNELIDLENVRITTNDIWYPKGYSDCEESTLVKRTPDILAEHISTLKSWWLATESETTEYPNWDMVCTATFGGTANNEGRSGLVLVEAKAHYNENSSEGKSKGKKTNEDNHERIGCQIKEVRDDLRERTDLKDWNIDRDSYYQMSNRFAWAWKLAEQDIPVLLMYLGFLNVEEMNCDGRKMFTEPKSWEDYIKKTKNKEKAPIVPPEIWDNGKIIVNNSFFIPILRTMDIQPTAKINSINDIPK